MTYTTQAEFVQVESYLVDSDGTHSMQSEVVAVSEFVGYTWLTLLDGRTIVLPNDQEIAVNDSAWTIEMDQAFDRYCERRFA